MLIYPGFPLPPGAQLPIWNDWLPVGAIIPFAGIAITEGEAAPGKTNVAAWGWLPCDGRSLGTNQYPSLFAALGYLYGGSDKQFNLPDYQGYFLRGLDPEKKIDKDPRVAPPGGTASDPGSTQLDALQQHVHQYQEPTPPVTTYTPGDDIAAVAAIKPSVTGGAVSGLTPPNTVRTSDNETRAVNIALNFLIRYTYMRQGNPFGPVPYPHSARPLGPPVEQ